MKQINNPSPTNRMMAMMTTRGDKRMPKNGRRGGWGGLVICISL